MTPEENERLKKVEAILNVIDYEIRGTEHNPEGGIVRRIRRMEDMQATQDRDCREWQHKHDKRMDEFDKQMKRIYHMAKGIAIGCTIGLAVAAFIFGYISLKELFGIIK